MNFFVFNDGGELTIANNFWIFIVTWLPATMATMLFYVLIVRFDAWWKGRPFTMFKRPKKRLY
jgi:hypothetical protein